MEKFEDVLNVIDYALNTTRKRHITGGILISLSLLCGSLAITVMSLKNEKKDEHERNEK